MAGRTLIVDRELTRDIRRLIEARVTPARWLEERVRAGVVAAAQRPGGLRPRPAWLGLAAGAVAALVIAALVVGVLVGSHMGPNMRQVPASEPAPSRDPGVVSYRALIRGDLNAVEFSFQLNSRCLTRAACDRALLQTRTGAETLLSDMSSARTPASLSGAALRVEAAAAQFIIQPDVALGLLQQPNTDYLASYLAPSMHDLHLTAPGVDSS